MNEFFELIKRLRTERTTPQAAAKIARLFGAICLGVALWNLVFLGFAFVNTLPMKVDTVESKTAIALLSVAGFLAIFAAGRLKGSDTLGVQLAKLALLSFAGALLLFLVGYWSGFGLIPPGAFGVVFRIFMAAAIAQFLVPAWFAFGYLNRLEFPSDGLFATAELEKDSDPISQELEGSFREGLFPFGAQVTFLVTLAGILLPSLLLAQYLGASRRGFVIMPGILLLLFGPMAWNELSSSFQRNRQILFSRRTGISMLFFSASAPFCKILIYRDGVEVRAEFNRYFLPYDRMVDPPKLEGFLSKSLVLRSRLPGVPESMRIRSAKAGLLRDEMEKARVG